MAGIDTPQPALTDNFSSTSCTLTNCGSVSIGSTQNIVKFTFQVNFIIGGIQNPSVKTVSSPEVTL